jgi:hypothetical protein
MSLYHDAPPLNFMRIGVFDAAGSIKGYLFERHVRLCDDGVTIDWAHAYEVIEDHLIAHDIDFEDLLHPIFERWYWTTHKLHGTYEGCTVRLFSRVQ